MSWFQPVIRRSVDVVRLIAGEFGRIPDYNAEGERLLRKMRNHRHGYFGSRSRPDHPVRAEPRGDQAVAL